mgnify:CR=1 FL=1
MSIYKICRHNIEEFKNNAAASEAEVSEEIDKLEKLIDVFFNSDSQIEILRNDVKETLHKFKMHDCTRDHVTKMLMFLENSVLEQILEEEKKAANIDRLRKFFKECADNAEEIAEVLNICQIFADR